MFLPLFVATAAVTDTTPAETSPSAPTPRDPTTGQPLPLVDSTGQPIILKDQTGQPIIVKDDSGQPIVPKDETGQILPPPPGTPGATPAPDALLPGRIGGFDLDPATAALRARGEGTAFRLHLALVEGYNSNVVQTGLNPTTPHPSLFTGIDAGVELLTATSPTDLQVIRLVVRGQHYTPLDGYDQLDDGTVIGSFARTITAGPRTFLTAAAFGTLTSSNSALISDGPVLVPDPSSLRRVYTVDMARLGFAHELGPRWRLIGGVDATVQATITDEQVFQTPNGTPIYHSGLDDFVPGVDATVAHDIDPYNIGLLMLRYELTDVPFVVDYTATPPTLEGSTLNNLFLANLGWNHAFSEYLRALVWGGVIFTTAPPLDPNQSVVVSPTADLFVTYLRPYWGVLAEASYSYGSVDPRLGFGPGEAASFTVQGVPYPHRSWSHLALLANGTADHAEYVQGVDAVAKLTFLGASIEARYALNDWLGLIAGYGIHYSTFDGAGAYPPLFRNVAFVGVSGYFANDRSLPLLTTFASPVTPM
jgi:hypothetical protein